MVVIYFIYSFIKRKGECVFTDKKGRAIALALVPIVVINVYAGCKMLSKTSKSKEVKTDISIEETFDKDVINEYTYLELDEGTIEVEQIPELDDVRSEINEFTKLLTIFDNSKLNVDAIFNMEDRDSILYVSALLAKLRDAGISEDIIKEELNNILVYGTTATCMSEEEWNRLFGNLSKTISIYDNVLDYYYPLAKYLHLSSCELEHSPLFFDEYRITCDKIQEIYNIYNPEVDIEDYFREMVSLSSDIRMINQLNELINSEIDFEVLLCELENVYTYSMIPRCIPEEEWNKAFGNLLKFIDCHENVCMYYYDLAFYIHELWCDFEHNLNQFGRYECDVNSKVLEI